jgi:serine/threonine-protein kinase
MKIELQVPTVTGVAPVVMQQRAPARGIPMIALAAMGVLLLGSITVSAVLINRAGAKPAAESTTAAASEPANVVTAAVARRPDTPAPAPSEPGASAAPAGSAKTTPAAPSLAAATSTAGPTATAPAAASSTRKTGGPPVGARVNCDPPYVVDKNGHQHFIPECLK